MFKRDTAGYGDGCGWGTGNGGGFGYGKNPTERISPLEVLGV